MLVDEFIDAGYLPEAVMNFLTNIGWNFGDDRELFSIDEAIERFELQDVNAANSAYPIKKLDWLNSQYIQTASVEHLARLLKPVLEKEGYTIDEELLLQVVPLLQVRLKTLTDVAPMAGFFFEDWSAFQAPPADILIQRKMDSAATADVLAGSVPVLRALSDFKASAQQSAIAQFAKECGLKNGQVFGTLRAAVTSQRVSPPTFETMEILGRDESLRRIQLARQSLAQLTN